MTLLTKLSLLTGVLLLSGCGGGKQIAPEPIQKNSYQLDVIVAGTDEAVTFSWLGKNLTASKQGNFNESASSYQPPSALQFPLKHQCSYAHTQLAQLHYQISINCQAEQTYRLVVSVAGTDQPIQFNWQANSHTVTRQAEITATGYEYQPPTAFVYPNNVTCQAVHKSVLALADTNQQDYQLTVTCQTPEVTTYIEILQPLPYQSMVQFGEQTVAVQNTDTLTLKSVDVSLVPSISYSDGPQLCQLTVIPEQARHYKLTCEEFLIAQHNTAGAAAPLMLFTANQTPLDLGLSTDLMLTEHKVFTWQGSYYFATNQGIYKMTLVNGEVDRVTLELNNDTSLTHEFYNQELRKLVALGPAGAKRLEDNGWQTVQATSGTNISALFSSQNSLSWLNKQNDNSVRLMQRVDGDTDRIKLAEQEFSRHSGYGTLVGEGTSVWTYWNKHGELVYQNLRYTIPTLIDVIPAVESPSVWQRSNIADNLVRLRDGQVQFFDTEADSYNFSWQLLFTDAANWLSGSKKLLLTGQQTEQSIAQINTVYIDGENTLPQLQASSQSVSPFWINTQVMENDQKRALNPKTMLQGWALLYQGSEQAGQIWLTNGKALYLVKDASNLAQYQALSLLQVGKQLALINNETTTAVELTPLINNQALTNTSK
ncbi:hypothetical protein ORJ04_06680 [Rheinheimera baltica]|uniref:Orphan protein n=1 Tax=Rheinheimera baltica TaxID=67576 RepID=A0ABT9HWY0_9GAMM|nr:hypothetical protein [Rheinheimera baltica]MDP5135632.1 hypothetical protein [Rheinheimera baltica]